MGSYTTLADAKYEEHVGYLENKRRRQAEVSENVLIKSLASGLRWAIGAISGSNAEMTAAMTELADIYEETVTAPTNLIAATSTETNTRKGTAVAVTAGNNTITFSSAFDDDGYVLIWTASTASGDQNAARQDPSTRATTGFDIYVAANGSIDYIAMEN